ncbi:EAL domain-containing protein [Brenneria rubrifaciens]|uniref:EAL domain-containing protein n=1 Tax=Brenneria rubrifaciens TaxID=55213 RepID=A0A4P8QPJ2_9GAMM|nr:EAL domain-containing protein [Brenneria rubrifaciens]QCR08346.1 EAL domain-containing protein [Brenneria rubrifaciens]
MLIRLDVDYVSDYIFWPIYNLDGTLLAVEMISRFNSVSGNLSIPSDILSTMLSPGQQYDLIREKINFITNKAVWFFDNNIILVMRIDQELVNIIIKSDTLRNEVKSLSFIQLEINEFFPNLSQGKENAALVSLSNSFSLWLDNFGSGKINLKPLNDGLLSCVKMDHSFTEHLLSRAENALIMAQLLRIIKTHYQEVRVVAKGIDTPEHLNKVKKLDIDAIQGELWPAVHFDELAIQADFFP